jgi:hypothetical protein
MISEKYKMTNLVNVAESPHILENKQQIYLQRVNLIFNQIKDWLPNNFKSAQIKNHYVIDDTGKYKAPILSIFKQIKNEPNELIADLFPVGTTVLMGEGLIEIHGNFGEESIIFLLKNGWLIQDRFGKQRPMYKEINIDGWYWIENAYRNKASLVNKEIFLDLLKIVSLYDQA